MDQVGSIEWDGYTMLPRLLCRSQVAALQEAVLSLRAARADGSCERPHNTLVPLRWDDMPVQSVLRNGAHLRRIKRAAEGTDLRWTSGYYSIKDPRTAALWWHQDWWCWDHPVTRQRRAAQVALLCYLDDTTVTTGALRVLPGSHLTSTPIHAVLPATLRAGAQVPDAQSAAMTDQPGQVTVEMEAGDAVMLDYRLLHGTHPNLAGRRRSCLILNFAPSWRQLPADVRAHLISGLALPSEADRAAATAVLGGLLPSYAGETRDLPLSRDAPADFSYRTSYPNSSPARP